MKEFIIYTDGSANSMNNGGSACIIQDVENLQNYNLMCSFGESTNNQAELFATFLGYEFINQFLYQQSEEAVDTKEVMVTIVSDSQYVLASSTKFIYDWQKDGKFDRGEVKNQHFWEAFLDLKRSYQLYPEHVKGHKGHGENEKCDHASGWCRENHEKNFASGTFIELEYPKKRKQKKRKREYWFYMNLDSVFKILRDGTGEEYAQSFGETIAASLVFENPKLLTMEERLVNDMAHKLYEAAALGTKYKHLLQGEKVLELVNKVSELYVELEEESA